MSRLMFRTLITVARPSRTNFGSMILTTVHQVLPIRSAAPRASRYPNSSCRTSEPRRQTFVSSRSKGVINRPSAT